MGGLEVLPKCEGSHVGKEDALWGSADCGNGGGESEDEEVDIIGGMHGSSEDRQ